MAKRRENLDQYYTDPTFIKFSVKKVKQRIPQWNNLCWIDFSAGNNDFQRILAAKTMNAFDLDPKDSSIRKMDWFNVKKNDVICGENEIAIGYNPPYGKGGNLARKFVKHAIETFSPKFLVLLSPVGSWRWALTNYTIIYKKMANNAFYIMQNDMKIPFSYRVPFIILQKRKTPRKESKCKSDFFTRISSVKFDEANLAVHRIGNGSMGRNIAVKVSPQEWKFYRNGKFMKMIDSPLSTHSQHSWNWIQLKNIGGETVAKNFLKHMNTSLLCETTPCHMGLDSLCKILNAIGRKSKK